MMKNYEKYAEEIRGFDYKKNFCDEFVLPHILKLSDCSRVHCSACRMLQTIWLFEEYEEPKESEVDWSKVEIDTPILVRNNECEEWSKRYFAKYKDEKVYTWNGGRTSWTTNCMTTWKYAKLAESEKGGAR